MNFHRRHLNRLPNRQQGALEYFEGLSEDKKRAEFVKILRALPFNEDLLKDTKFSEIRLAGQYL